MCGKEAWLDCMYQCQTYPPGVPGRPRGARCDMRGPEFEVTERSSDEELMRLLADGGVSDHARQKAGDVLVTRWYEHLKSYARRLFRLSAGGCSTDLAEDVV